MITPVCELPYLSVGCFIIISVLLWWYSQSFWWWCWWCEWGSSHEWTERGVEDGLRIEPCGMRVFRKRVDDVDDLAHEVQHRCYSELPEPRLPSFWASLRGINVLKAEFKSTNSVLTQTFSWSRHLRAVMTTFSVDPFAWYANGYGPRSAVMTALVWEPFAADGGHWPSRQFIILVFESKSARHEQLQRH